MDQDKAQHASPPLIPCIYCNHSNPANHRFCGMCSKALPDLVKQAAKGMEGASGLPIPGSGIGVAGRRPIAPSASRLATGAETPGSRHDNANRDLSYLLHDDHVPARTSRLPYLVAGVLLVSVAGFFALRGGSKTGSGSSGSAAQPPDAATTTNTESAKAEPRKDEASRLEPGKIPPVANEPTQVDPGRAKPQPTEKAPPPAREIGHRSMAAPLANAKRAPKPTASRKPSPAKHATAAAEDSADSPGAVSADCEKQLPSLRRASARGDAKARASLGLIYYAGRCVPRDLPTAYRWYALALRTAPDSPQVAAQLEAIWKQMSPAERQLAQKPQ